MEYIQNGRLLSDDFPVRYAMTLSDIDVTDFGLDEYAILAKQSGFVYRTLSTAEQVHGTHIACARPINSQFPKTDGLIGGAGDLLIIRTADCLPVAFYDAVHHKTALVHSGWRGTMAKISECAIWKMKDAFGTQPRDLSVHIGPGIDRESFEVERDVIDILHRSFPDMHGVYEKITDGKYHLDLQTVLVRHLVSLGVPEGKIFVSAHSTYRETIFHSYRRDKKSSGRSATMVMAEEL